MKRISLFLFLAGYSITSLADRIGFKGVNLGASEASVMQQFAWAECKDVEDKIAADRICWADNDIVDIDARTVLYLYNDNLQAIQIRIAESAFPMLLDMLKEKYGQPTASKQEALQNRIGAKFTNIIYTWTKAPDSVQLQRYADKIGESQINYETASYIKEFTKRDKIRIKDGAKGL